MVVYAQRELDTLVVKAKELGVNAHSDSSPLAVSAEHTPKWRREMRKLRRGRSTTDENGSQSREEGGTKEPQPRGSALTAMTEDGPSIFDKLLVEEALSTSTSAALTSGDFIRLRSRLQVCAVCGQDTTAVCAGVADMHDMMSVLGCASRFRYIPGS